MKKSNCVTEIVTFEAAEAVTKEQMVNIIDGLENEYHTKQPGFIDTELIFDEEKSLWIMIQHWDNTENLKKAASKMFKEQTTENFRNALNPESVKISIYRQIKSWKV